MTRAHGPDRNALDLARFIEGIIAPQLTAARQTILERFITADGHTTQTIGAAPPPSTPAPDITGKPCLVDNCTILRPCRNHDGATLTTVERAADTRTRQTTQIEGITDRFDGIRLAVTDLAKYLRTIMGAPTAEDIHIPATPMCCDNQIGREGAAEWGQPDCPLPATTTGLCSAHYQAARKYRITHGLRDTTTQPATDEHYPDGYRARAPRHDPAA